MQDKNMQGPEVIDLRDVWHSVTKHMGLIRKVTLATTAVAVAYAFLMPPTYQSTALIRIKPQKGISSSLLDAMPMGNAQANTQLQNTYQEILKSRSVVEPAIKKAVKPNKDGLYPAYEAYVKGNITSMPFKNTEMVQVSVKAKSPEEAKQANDALLESFLNRLTEIERTQYAMTRTFIEGRLGGAKKELHEAEDLLNKFQKDHKIITPDDAVKLAADKFSMTDKMKAENQISLEAANAKSGALASSLNSGASAMADNDVIRSYNAELTKLEAQRVEYATKYTQKHPAVIKINQDIAELQAKLNQAIAKVASGQSASTNPVYNGLLAEKYRSDAEASVAQSNLKTIADIQAKYGEDLATLTDNQKEYVRLLRDVNVAQEIYSMLAKRLEEAKVAEVSISRDVQIVDKGDVPIRPIAPRKGMSIILGFLLGLLGSCGFVIARDLMNRTIKSNEDVEKYLGLPVLGQIPSMESLNEAQEVAEMSTFEKIWRTVWKN